MAGRPETPTREDDPRSIFDGAFRLVVVLALGLVVLMVVRVLGDATAGGGPAGAAVGSPATAAVPSPDPASSGPPPDPRSFLLPSPRPAADLALTGSDGRVLTLASMRGAPVLVFFGYTHCPDVCPATIGRVGEAIDAVGGGARAVFVSVDPERDTVDWLAEFVRYLPAGFSAVTGTPAAIRSTADAWGVRYAKVVEADPAEYSVSHTADVFVVDAAGMLRASLPFGTEAASMADVVRLVAAEPIASAASAASAPAPSASAVVRAPAGLEARVVSSSVWAGGHSPIILALFDEVGRRIDDVAATVTVQLLDPAGTPTGAAVPAAAVQPVGIADVSFVPTVDIPTAGPWRLAVTAAGADGSQRQGVVDVTALDPGGTAALGAPAPTIRTPTAADFGGDQTWVTTDPLPDPRLTRTSTVDALAARTPFVLVVDSVRFRVTPVCGRAVVMAKQLVDRWTSVPFIHHEPYRFTVVTDEPVLEGSLADPRLTDAGLAWGVGSEPWGVKSMPWIFVVDGDGVVRAKYQGVMGSADVDVILSMLGA